MTARSALAAEPRRSARANGVPSARGDVSSEPEPECSHQDRENRFEHDFSPMRVHAGRPDSSGDEVPPIVREAIRAPGERLEPELLETLEQRDDFSRASAPRAPARVPEGKLVLGHVHDPSERAAEATARGAPAGGLAMSVARDVRVHSGDLAARAAAAIDAQAFTVGNDIVFGAGRFAPASRAGRFLLEHELAHVAQHALGAPAHVVRRRSIFESAAIFLGLSEGEFGEKELLDYLAAIVKANAIEDHYDSDNKARAIVRRWKAGEPKFRLNAHQMTLLIKEMESGYVGSEDQTGIFDLLSHAANGDLRIIFGSDGVSPKELESDFSGDMRKRLQLFYDTRFEGGRAALDGGKVEPISGPAAGAPSFDWDFAAFTERIENPAYTDDELAAEVSALPEAKRNTALKAIGERRNELQKAFVELADKVDAEHDAAKQTTLKDALRALARHRQRFDAILQPAFRDIALAETPASLLPKTHTPAAAEKAEIAKALKPDLQTGAGGAALPFVEKIPPETKSYGQKIEEYMPEMVKKYYDHIVVGKGPAEHADPAKTHQLDEFDSIAGAARDAVNAVYGPYIIGAHPAMRSDRPAPVGRGQLHDLFADTQKQLAVMGPGAKRAMAKALVLYFFQNNRGIDAFNRKHNADPKFAGDGTPLNKEAKISDAIADRWVASAAHVKQLNEIDRNWDASADPRTHEVNLQIFKAGTPDEDRWFLWDMLQTLIHEYIHTIAAPAYVTFAEHFGPGQQNTTLIEGVDSFLTEIVWSQTKTKTADPALRGKVEGAAYSGAPFDATVIPPIYNRRYPSYAQAVKLVNVVGIRNLYAAYFMGKVDLIKPS
jgi:hypothetical protein